MKKKIYSLIIFIFALFTSVNYVLADTFTASLVGEDTFEDEFTLKLRIDSLTGFSNGLYGIDTMLNYNDSKITLIGIRGQNNFDVTYDVNYSNKIVAYSHIGAPVNTDIFSLVFKKRDISSGDSVTISFKNSIASDGENDIAGTITGKTVTYSASEPNYQKGDMNKDGTVGLADVIYLLKMYLGVEEITDSNLELGDMNSDREIGLADVIMLLRVYLGVN